MKIVFPCAVPKRITTVFISHSYMASIQNNQSSVVNKCDKIIIPKQLKILTLWTEKKLPIHGDSFNVLRRFFFFLYYTDISRLRIIFDRNVLNSQRRKVRAVVFYFRNGIKKSKFVRPPRSNSRFVHDFAYDTRARHTKTPPEKPFDKNLRPFFFLLSYFFFFFVSRAPSVHWVSRRVCHNPGTYVIRINNK